MPRIVASTSSDIDDYLQFPKQLDIPYRAIPNN